jgi:SagB-type dehydrogenase family enzyme
MISRTGMVIAIILCLSVTVMAAEYDELMQEAQSKMRAKEYGAALELFAKAFQIGEAHYSDYYNAACMAALTGDADAAFAYLDKAIDAGLLERAWLENDPDLETLRAQPRWESTLAALDGKVEAFMASFPDAHAEAGVIDLPEPRIVSDASVEEALKHRRSIREYADTPMTLAEISQLLWAAYGITEPVEDGPDFLRGGLRTAPSAGARYPLELYVVVRNVKDLAPGVYWYKSETHQLTTTSNEDRWEALSEAGLNQVHFETAAAAIVYSAVFERNMEVYGSRGRERYVCMDLGHSAENVYLQAYALKVGTCAVGAFGDLALKKVAGMTRAEEPLYIMPLGKVE